MPDPSVAIQREIEIDGSKLPDNILIHVESTTVIDRLSMPDTFTLVFRDPDRNILSTAGIQVGTKVVISTTSTREDAPKVLIDAEVTSIETEYGAHGTLAVVRGYDRSHRLAAGRKSKTFLNAKYSDIATQLASAAGLTPDVDESEGTHDHVFQANQSDLDFLSGLARQIGYDCRVDGENLLFKKPVESSSGPGRGRGPGHQSDRPRVGRRPARLPGPDERRGAGQQGRGPGLGPRDEEGDHRDGAGDGEQRRHADEARGPRREGRRPDARRGRSRRRPQQVADQMANAGAAAIGSAAFEATAITTGSPDLKAGVAVNVGGVDPALAGKWVISGSRHEFGDGFYRTSLEFAGRQDRSDARPAGPGRRRGANDRIYGLVIGIVTDNNDPDNVGRVKVKFPWLGDDVESWWARIAAPGAGPDYGVVWVPQVNDEVLVGLPARRRAHARTCSVGCGTAWT